MNYNVYLAINTAILNIQVFSRRYHFRLWVFALTGEYFYYRHRRVLPNVLESKYDGKSFQNLVYYLFLCFVLTNYHMYCIVQIGSTGALKIIIDLVLCIVRSHQKDIKLYVY